MTAHATAEQKSRRWAVVTAVAGTVCIAAGAFWLSFTALADLAARSGVGGSQAWAWPLIVDGIIVVATVSVVAMAGQKAAWYPWALLIGGAAVSVTANAIHAVVAADADVPGVLAAAVAAVPPVVLLAITHLTVILTRPPFATATSASTDEPVATDAAVPNERSVSTIEREVVEAHSPDSMREPGTMTSGDTEIVPLPASRSDETKSSRALGTAQAPVGRDAELSVVVGRP